MIALAVAAAVTAARLAPPLDTDIAYRIVDDTPGAPQDTRVTTEMTLRFRREDDRLIAAARTISFRIEAPAPIRARLLALFGPLTGPATQAEVTPDGRIGAIVDPEPSWRAFLASQQALLARVEATHGMPPDRRALARDAVRAHMDPARRDEFLRPALAQLLPPPLPPLAPGEPRRAPAIDGQRRTDSIVALIAVTPDWLDYSVETVTPADEGSVFAEVSTVRIERTSGMLLAAHGRRELRRPGVAPIVISTHDAERAPVFLR